MRTTRFALFLSEKLLPEVSIRVISFCSYVEIVEFLYVEIGVHMLKSYLDMLNHYIFLYLLILIVYTDIDCIRGVFTLKSYLHVQNYCI